MPLVPSDNVVLQSVSENWIFDLDKDPEILEKNLIETMVASNGIGLSANQVGITKRVFSISLQNHPNQTAPFAMFNPVIISFQGEEELGREGCLSFPNLWLEVKRPSKIEAEYFDKYAKKCTIMLEGIDARCFLHELDHLNGICFIEKVSKFKLNYALKKLRKINGRTK